MDPGRKPSRFIWLSLIQYASSVYAFVSREQRRPKVEVYHWTTRCFLPTVMVPLAGDDPDVPLDLQAIFTDVYDRAGYDYSLNYHEMVEPPLSEADITWVRDVLAADGRGA